MTVPTALNLESTASVAKISLDSVRHAIEHAKHYLPTQGPIAVFIHHNTLHAFEHMPFDEAVVEGLRTYGSQPYWQESRYREEMARDRIQGKDLQAVLSRDLGASSSKEIAKGTTRYDLRHHMLLHPVLTGSDAELKWLFAQSDALDQFRSGVEPHARQSVLEATRHWIMRDLRLHLADKSSAIPAAIRTTIQQFPMHKIESWSDSQWQQLTLQLLWRICQNGVHNTAPTQHRSPPTYRHRDILLKLSQFDCDSQVHELLIRFTSAFLDQGFAAWSVPHREDGFYRCFLTLFEEKSLWAEK